MNEKRCFICKKRGHYQNECDETYKQLRRERGLSTELSNDQSSKSPEKRTKSEVKKWVRSRRGRSHHGYSSSIRSRRSSRISSSKYFRRKIGNKRRKKKTSSSSTSSSSLRRRGNSRHSSKSKKRR